PIRVSVTLGTEEIKLTRAISLVAVERESPQPPSSPFAFGSQLRGLLSAKAAAHTPPPKIVSIAFRIKVVGYLDGKSSDSAAEAALATLRQFVALGLAQGVVERADRSDVTFNAR